MANNPVSETAKPGEAAALVTPAPAAKSAAPAVKAAAKPAAKPAKKPVAKAAVKAKAKSKTAAKAAKPKKAAAPVAKSAKPKKAAAPKTDKSAKPKKSKLVRDSFTMPEAEYDLFAAVKKRCVAKGVAVKKSEVLRAALASFAAQSDAAVMAAVKALAVIKTGRKPKGTK